MKKLLISLDHQENPRIRIDQIANAFVKQYKENKPRCLVDELNLWKEKILHWLVTRLPQK